MSIEEEVLEANRAVALDLAADTGPDPARAIAVLTCMDARVDPLAMLGLERGDAHVIRNAGGRASVDALRSLLLSTYVLGTRTVLVIHHTDCGLSLGPEDTLAAVVEAGGDPGDIELLAFDDLEESVREDVRIVGGCGLLPVEAEVLGFVYEVETGRLRPVPEG